MIKYIKSAVCLLLALVMCVSCGKHSDSKKETNKAPNETVSSPETQSEPSVIGPSDYKLRINEVLYDNSVFRFGGKEAYSFVEIYNYGSEDINLDGITLVLGEQGVPLKGSIAKGGYFLFFPGSDAPARLGQSSLSVRLSPKCTVSLVDKTDLLIHSLTLPELKKDISFAYKAPVLGQYLENEYVTTSIVTPGYENSEKGLTLWYENNDAASGLVINEVMSANREYLETLNSYYDWIELKNNSQSAVNLKDYYLSDKESDLKKWQLPDVQLAAGEVFVVFAEKDDAQLLISKGYVCCGFSLSAEREQVYLSDKEGNITDAMMIVGASQNGSYGRLENESGFFYFEKPTPEKDNQNGKRLIATTPVFSNNGGVFNDSKGVAVSIQGEGEIYYTLDGSVPTKQSKKYSGGSISIGQTGVLRAVSIVDGKISSRAATASFIMNENHSLPVLSIAIDPEDMYGDKTGIYVVGEGNDPDAWAGEANYTKGWEKSVHAAFFETDGSGFSLDCGIKIAGSGTKAFPKKSFQLKFRGIYGASELEYDIFGTGAESFQSIKLRCGEDYYRTTFRDELQASLVMDMGGLLAQRYRWCVLYIDSEYFGLYAFRDMTDENYVAKVENADSNDVLILEHDGVGEVDGKKDYYKEFMDFVTYCSTKDLSNYENYRYVTERLDIESFTKWFIARSYGSDRDFGNCRFYRIRDDGKWKVIFYDCDWGFYYEYVKRSPYAVLDGSSYQVFPAIKIMKALLKNAEYKDYFLTTLGEQLRTAYKAENILAKIEAFDALLHSEIPRDREKWDKPGYSGTYEKYVYMVEELKKFAKEAPAYRLQSTKEYFNLSDSQMKQYFDGIL